MSGNALELFINAQQLEAALNAVATRTMPVMRMSPVVLKNRPRQPLISQLCWMQVV